MRKNNNNENAITSTTPSMKGVIVLLVAAALVLAATTIVITSPPSAAYADKEKSKIYVSESGTFGVSQTCNGPFTLDCKDYKEANGGNPNKVAREICEQESGEKCKQN